MEVEFSVETSVQFHRAVENRTLYNYRDEDLKIAFVNKAIAVKTAVDSVSLLLFCRASQLNEYKF
jgi:hypothetical protein